MDGTANSEVEIEPGSPGDSRPEAAFRLGAAETLARLDSGALRVEELMESCLARIEAVNPAVNAIVSLLPRDELLARAREADAVPHAERGPLHGLPIAVKDLVNVAGIETSMGSPLFAGRVAEADDLLAARIRAAGAIPIGKTNTPEFGLGSHTFNPVHGATLNAYDSSRSAGGSSGGAAVALAAGMVCVADGSDMMGSLRNPAGWNNVYGFRPGWGVVPGERVGDAFLHQLATAGPMARSPADMTLLLDAIAGPDPGQPHSVPYQRLAPLAPLAARADGAKIGWLGDWGGAFPTEPGILGLCESALGALSDLGCAVESVEPPFDAEEVWRSWTGLRSWQVAMLLRPLADRRDGLKDSAQWELDRGLAMSGADVHDLSVIRTRWFARCAELFETFDALALPTAQVWPFEAGKPWVTEIGGVEMDTYHRWMQVAVPSALAGLPTVAVPAGFGDAGLPGGLQLFGPRGGDGRILALAQAYHEATDWPARRPANPQAIASTARLDVGAGGAGGVGGGRHEHA